MKSNDDDDDPGTRSLMIPEMQNYNHRQASPSITKWLYRRFRKLILLQTYWPNVFIFSILLIIIFFLLLSSHLYVLLIHQSNTGDNDNWPQIDNLQDNNFPQSNYSRYIDELSSLSSHANYRQRTIQINEQLLRIESSLKENRLLLQTIRSSLHFLDHHNKTLKLSGQQIWLEDKFHDQSICPLSSTTRRTSGDINIERLYEELEFDNLDGGVWKQGWPLEIKNEQDFKHPKPKLKIFIVPHSHNDPGWIKTFDVYFSKQTQHILTNAVEFMTQHSDMKFIWAETSYLSAWWETQDDQHRALLKQLIDEGRFEIVTGGWVMNDEANTHYWSMLQQMIEGHEWLNDVLNCQPKYGWAIDPFGLSPTMAYLLKHMNFRAMVIQRVHYSIKKYLAKHKQLEFRWQQHWEQSNSNQEILCHIEPFYSYDIPHTCGPDPKICCQFDFKRLPPGKPKCPWKINPQVITKDNLEERAKTLLDQYRKKSMLFRSHSLLIPLGDDFRYDDIKEWRKQYENYRRIMDYLNHNEHFNVHIQFATLNDYFESVLQEVPVDKFSSLVGDFFTYADRDDHYWSGYYTSKPFYKRFERILASHLRATELLFSMANILTMNFTTNNNNLIDDPFGYLNYEYLFARQNLALFQHHDGITGTAKDTVVVDYANRMLRSFKILQQMITASLSAITGNPVPELVFMNHFKGIASPLKKHLFHLNGTDSKKYFILYNSLPWSLDAQVFCFDVEWTMPASSSNNETAFPDFCLTSTGTETSSTIRTIQINHVWPEMPSTSHQPLNIREICFQPRLDASSLVEYCFGQCLCSPSDRSGYRHLEKHESFVTLYNWPLSSSASPNKAPFDYHILSMINSAPNTTIENEWIRLVFDNSPAYQGLLKSWSFYNLDTKQWQQLDFRLKLMIFGTRGGGKSVQKSGAYIFLPDKPEPVLFDWLGKPKIRVTIGAIESRYEWMINEPFPVHIRFSLYRGRPSVELETEFHLQGQKSSNRELLLRFEIPNIQNGRIFYTDLNGLQMITRKRLDKIPLQGNVYPLNTMAWIQDERFKFTVVTGQPLGVTSLHPGTMEVFLDRRLSQDDFRGLNQGVMDNRQTKELFRLMLQPVITTTQQNNSTSQYPRATSGQMFESQTLLNPVIGLTAAALTESSKQDEKRIITNGNIKKYRLLKRPLPCDVILVNLRRSIKKWNEFNIWLHRTEFNCHSKCIDENNGNQINLIDYLNEDIVSRLNNSILQTGISGGLLHQNTKTNLNDTLLLEPMKFITYRLFRIVP